MATKFEKLDKQLDRLEKLFSRKKRASGPQELPTAGKKSSALVPSSAGADSESPIFPQPSFIRPTSSRMMAREEVVFRPHPTRRSKSLPGSSNAAAFARAASTSSRIGQVPALPTRYASIRSGVPQRASVSANSTPDDPSRALWQFSFPASEDEASTQRRPRSSSKSLNRSASMSLSPKARPDRKRHSATGELEPSFMPQRLNCHSEPTRDRVNPASETPSGENRLMDPSIWPKPPLRGSRRHTMLGSAPNEATKNSGNLSRRPLSLTIPTTDARPAGKTLYRPASMSRLSRAKSEPDLKEPSVDDFLSLSDDDIADGQTALRTRTSASRSPTIAPPPNPSLLRSPVWTGPAQPMLTLSPPLASRPATAAAFEAARIAAKYRFDLVYVVNLWPSHMSHPSRSSPLSRSCGTPVAMSPHHACFGTSSPPESPASPTSGYDSGFESPGGGSVGTRASSITGRLLAAYGLDSVQYPFRISVPANLKALRTDDWLEFRNYSGALNEFAVGYSRAFYTGYSPARGVKGGGTSPAAHDGGNTYRPPNRGIVFSGFRVPDVRGNPILSDARELQELHRDAEAFVDMLIEMHMSQRQRRTPTGTPRRLRATPAGGRMTKPAAVVAA